MDALAHQHVAARILSGHVATTRTALRPQQGSPMLPAPFVQSQTATMTRSTRVEARRAGRDDADWELREEWQDFPRSKDDGRRRGTRFDPFGTSADQSTYWEQRAAQIQQAAQMRARRAAEQFGVQDVRVEAVPSKDMGRFLLPTLGVVAAAILAGPFIGFMMMMAGLVVGGMMFSGSLLFALTFALPLLFGAGAVGMLSFWTFGLASVAFSLALPVLFAGAAFSAFRMLAGAGTGFAAGRGAGRASSTVDAAAAQAEAKRREEEEEQRLLEAELRDFDSRLERSARSKKTMY